MSWLSHFTGWVGEKSKTILPIVTGIAGFAAGMIPGVGGTVSKMIDGLGNKISGGAEALEHLVGLGGDTDNPASPQGEAVASVTPRQSIAETASDIGVPGSLSGIPAAVRPGQPAPPATPVNPLIYVGAGLLGLVLLSRK